MRKEETNHLTNLLSNIINEQLDKQELRKSIETKYSLKIDDTFTPTELQLISKALSYFKKKFIANHIKQIQLTDLGAVHGKWISIAKDTGNLLLNPRIFAYTKSFKGQDDIPYYLFTIMLEY